VTKKKTKKKQTTRPPSAPAPKAAAPEKAAVVAAEKATAAAEKELELARLRRELDEVRSQAAQHLDGWQRAQADFANYRKRRDAEQQRQTQLSNAQLIVKALPVLDDLERAAQTLPPEVINLPWTEGILLIKRKLEVVLETEGVRPIETTDCAFDPFYHEAVSYEESPGREDGQIIAEVCRGYTLGDQVIRPALVRVACAPTVLGAAISPQPTEGE
jgi:molecular chaperone GrpE